ncbi:MAG: hypothetical protein ACRBK7_25800 [Acidimicrobiales bacterium]
MSRIGYWPSAWPVECGDNHRPKAIAAGGLNLQPTDRLVATTRQTGRWPVMFVQRDPGELYLHGTTSVNDASPAGWIERVDPVSLQPLTGSGDLPSGGHEWCGSMAVHRNGDLYTVNGSYLHRLDPQCWVVAETALPVDHAHNGLLILDDGSIVTKDIQLGDVASTLTVCDEDLQVLASIRLPEASMGRIAAMGEVIYVPGTTGIYRYRWNGSDLKQDLTWAPSYRTAGQRGLAGDVAIDGGRVWLMDNGNIPTIERRFSQTPTLRAEASYTEDAASRTPGWIEPIRAIGISVEDPTDVIELLPTEHPAGWVIAPPLVSGNIAVAWDTGNMGIAAFDISNGRTGEMLWFQPFRASMQPLLYRETNELVINDFRMLDDNETSDDLVVLDVRTGQMKARVPTGATMLNGMFPCPGWDRDLYYCSTGTVARVQAVSL